MITAYRIVRPEFADDPFSGQGARRDGGRWNSPGVAMAYASATPSLATLELLVNIPRSLRLPRYTLVTCHFPEAIVDEISSARLPPTWRDFPPPGALQKIGDAWIHSRTSAVLRVPSAVIDLEFNYLLNPDHSDFRSVEIGDSRAFTLDFRLLT